MLYIITFNDQISNNFLCIFIIITGWIGPMSFHVYHDYIYILIPLLKVVLPQVSTSISACLLGCQAVGHCLNRLGHFKKPWPLLSRWSSPKRSAYLFTVPWSGSALGEGGMKEQSYP